MCTFLLWLSGVLGKIVARKQRGPEGAVQCILFIGMKELDPDTALPRRRGDYDSAPCP